MGSITGYMTTNGVSYKIHHKEFQLGKFKLIFQYCKGRTSYRIFNDVIDLSSLDDKSSIYGEWKRYFLEIGHFGMAFEYRIN